MSKTVYDPCSRLQLFIQRAKELHNRRFAISGYPFKFHIYTDKENQKITYEIVEKPDEEDLRAFVLDLRRFISEREPVFIRRIFNDCEKYLQDEKIKQNIRDIKSAWVFLWEKGLIQMSSGGKNLPPEKVMDLWINGQYFHDDIDKKEELEQLLNEQIPCIQIQFMISLPSLARVINLTAEIVEYAMNKGLFSFVEKAPINI